MAEKFYIGPYDQGSGQINNVKPFYLADQAYERLENAYVWRGRVKKRPGSRLIGNGMSTSRLRVNVGTLGAGTASGTVPAAAGQVGQMFSIGTNLFTVNVLGSPVDMLIDGTASTARFDTATGVFVFTGVAAPNSTVVYWYPGFPVMGLIQQEVSGIVNTQPTIAFDTTYSYSYNTTTNGWERITGGGAASVWLGDDTNYFQASNWFVGTDTALFVTNNNAGETQFMRYLVGSTWSSFKPVYDSNAGTFILTAKFLVLFKNRLLALAPTIGSSAPGVFMGNLVAIPASGDPASGNPYDIFTPGRGTSLAAATNEQIISYAFIKDRLIVFFERSTFELVYVGNEYYPFTWQKINTELGVESPNSVVEFDKFAIGVGNVGVHACNGANVERIDENIPDFVFSIHNAQNGVTRVYGVRDFQSEMVYWAYPSDTANTTDNTFPIQPYCDSLLLYNYNNGTWAFAKDTIMVFGYFQVAPNNGISWDSDVVTWDDDVVWGGASTIGQSREVLAGNQQGYTFIFDYEMAHNAQAMSITDLNYTSTMAMLTVINHNLRGGDWIFIDGITPAGLSSLNKKNYQVFMVADANTFTINIPAGVYTGTYSGGGQIGRVNNILIKTKQFNPYAQKGINTAFNQVDLLLDKTSTGSTTLQFATSTSTQFNDNVGNEPIIVNTYPYVDFYPYEAQADQVWRSIYPNCSGSYIQLQFQMSDDQMAFLVTDQYGNVSGPTREDFELHAIVLTVNPSGRLQ